MKILFFLACSFITVHSVSFFDLVLEEWQLFKLQHNKTYPSDTEEKFRLKIFMDNKLKVAKHNARFQRGEVSFQLGLNKYSDMLHHEFVEKLNGFKKTQTYSKLESGMDYVSPSAFIAPANVKLPDYVNWTEKGAVTPVKDQGRCGSCWAFSSTGALEGQHFRKTGVLISLSEQNLIDCSTKEGNDGCNGGLMDNAFVYVKKNRGIDTEKSYPYEGEDGKKCRYNPSYSGATDTGFVDIPSGDEEALKAAVATIGPVSVAIDASQASFQMYSQGVYNDAECRNGSNELDHGVLVVGYGTDDETQMDYWLVKNSWSSSWGENGYIKMARNQDNMCGIATAASYPLV